MESLKWNDDKEIAKRLFKKYPDKPPVVPSREQLRELVIKLEGFDDEPEPPHSVYLTAIQRSWIILWHGPGAEESLSSTRPDLVN